MGIRDAYRTGRGSIRMRAVAEIVENERGSDQIVVTEVPYQTSVDQIARKAAELVERGDLTGLREIRNESAKGQDPPGVRTQARRHGSGGAEQPLQVHADADHVQCEHGGPGRRACRARSTLRDLPWWPTWSISVRSSAAGASTGCSEARATGPTFVEGLLRALDMIDAIIAAIRASEDRGEARQRLMGEGFEFSEVQANFILDHAPWYVSPAWLRADLEEELRGSCSETIAELEAHPG